MDAARPRALPHVQRISVRIEIDSSSRRCYVQPWRRQGRRAGSVREARVSRKAVCCNERADLVAVLRRWIEPRVGPADSTGGGSSYQGECPTWSICRTMHLEAGLIGRVVLPGDVDLTVRHCD